MNKLSSNISKTHPGLLSKIKNVKSDTYVVKLDNTIINQVKCIKCLGPLIEENLNWHEHIYSCISKIKLSIS